MSDDASILASTPRAAGYRMPAEWSPHRATWIAWPHNPDDWPGKFSPIPWVYAEIVRHLAEVEDVEIVVDDAAMERTARRALRHAGASTARVYFHRWPTNRVWTRDSGPIFVERIDPSLPGPRLGLTNWKFNAWAKYDDWQLDDQLPAHIARDLKIPEWMPTHGDRRIVLEGGSIDVNGSGTLMTTEECLLSEVQARNPGLPREDLEAVLGEYLGIEQVLWLGRGIVGDDTHGHVDDVARFVGESTIVAAVEPHRAIRTTWRSPRTSSDCMRRVPRTAARTASSNCPCRRRFPSTASAYPPVTRTSTSQTNLFWCLRSTTGTIGAPSRSSRGSFQAERS
ncbi:Peptidyl-arginine deiminase, Porphyromonas-type [mine drainage metagenome]|uniref:Peptidyl-arginine deiminase, Porphyromonas-type n=1 Tax=mine drainage metagenome TaxID=410659 RepID=T1ABB5_9ZZZZ